MPATGSRVARTAFARLMVRCAVGLRIGSAVAAGIAAFVGLAPPASVAAVATAVTVTTVWSAAYAVLLLRRRGGGWPVAADAGVAALLGLAVGRLVPARAPSRRASIRARDMRRAGTRPNPTPVKSVAANAMPRTRASSGGVSAIGRVGGTRRAMSGAATAASARPAIPPMPASTTLSVNI